MPALPSPGNVMRLHARFGPSDTNQWGTRNYFKYSGGAPSSADLNTLCQDWFTALATNIMPSIESNIFLTEVSGVDLASDLGAEGLYAGSQAGGDSSGKVPEDVSAQVNHLIARHYRGGQPKTFLPPGGTGALADDKSWTSDFTGAIAEGWAAAVAALVGVVAGGTTVGDLVNISYYKGFTVFMELSGRARNVPNVRTTPIVDDVISHSVRGEVASQRRRRTAITG